MSQAGTVWVDVRGNTAPLAMDIGKAAAAASALAFVGLGAAAVRESTQFNKAISGVGAVANATAADLELLRKAALQAGADTSFSASEAAVAEAELAKAGLSTADVLGGALTGSLDLAAAGQLDLQSAAIITAQALNTFNLNGSETAHVADVLAAGANKSAADVSQLGQALAQGGLVAKQTGLSLEDTVGVLSLFADNALVGSDAGTSLKTMLQRLVPQSDEAKKAMEDLGLSFFDAGGEFVGIGETAQQLKDSLSGLSTEQRQNALTTIFGADAIRAASLLYESGAEGVRDYTDAVNDQGAAQRMASAQLDNLSGDLEALRGSWETVLIGLGSSADSGLRDIVQALTAGVNTVGEFVQSPVFDQVTEAVGGVLADLASGLASAGDGLQDFLGNLDTSDVSGFFDALRDGAEGLEGPIAGLAAALAAMTAAKLPVLRGLVPGLTPLQGVLAGIVLQSEEGREALGSMFDVATDAAEAFTPVIGVASDVLGVLADQGWLVKAALDAFIASKIVAGVTPIIGAVGNLASNFTFLRGEIASIAATRGIGQLEALGGVAKASAGSVASLASAFAGPAGLTALVAGGLYIYQDWADAQQKVEEQTRRLTDALLEQGAVDAARQLAQELANTLDADEGVSKAFGKTGLAISEVTSIINNNAGELSAFSDTYDELLQDIAEGNPSVDASTMFDGLSEGARPFIENLWEMRKQGIITMEEFKNLIHVFAELDQSGAKSAQSIGIRAQRFKEEAEGVKLSAEAQQSLATALDNNASLQDRRDAIDDLREAYPDLAQAAGIATDAIEQTDAASTAATSSTLGLAGGLNVTASAASAAGGVLKAAGAAIAGVGRSADDASSSVLSLLDAQDSAEDATRRIATAQKNLNDILAGNTEGVRNATEGLREAQQALADARAETGPGSKASRDAARDLREARKALRDAQVEAGREPQAGDFFEDKRDAVLDALDRVGEAQKKLDEINAGTSEQVVAASDRVAEAERRLAEELKNTGPLSEAARDAQEELSDAQRNGAGTSMAFGDALGKVATEDIPKTITALQTLRDQYGLNKEEVDKLIGSLLIKSALEQPAPAVGRIVTPSPRPRVPQHIDGFGPGRAAGGDVWAGSAFPTNELGAPEMFASATGAHYMVPNQAGTVTPMTDVVGAIQAMHRDLLRSSPSPAVQEDLAPLMREVVRLLREQTNTARTGADVRRGAVAFA